MTVAFITPTIENDELARFMGGGKRQRVSRPVRKSIHAWNERIGSLIDPSLAYVVKSVRSVDQGGIFVDTGLYFKSPKIAKTMKDCTDIVCFIATIDGGLEKAVTGLLRENRLSDAYILDSMGSVAVESMVNQFHERLEKRYKQEGRSVTLRFSPGYCDWNIAEQKKLFGLIDKDEVNVTLRDDSCLMAPRKSVSGVFGILPYDNGGTIASYNPCRECGNIQCHARRAEKGTHDDKHERTG